MADDTNPLGPHQTLRVIASSPDALELEAEWQPGGGPPPAHYHTHQNERFEVLEGELTVVLGEDEQRVLGAGEVLDVPLGTVHRMWTAGPTAARARWRVTPALRTEEMFRTIAAGGAPDFFERYAAGLRFPG